MNLHILQAPTNDSKTDSRHTYTYFILVPSLQTLIVKLNVSPHEEREEWKMTGCGVSHDSERVKDSLTVYRFRLMPWLNQQVLNLEAAKNSRTTKVEEMYGVVGRLQVLLHASEALRRLKDRTISKLWNALNVYVTNLPKT